MSSCTLTHCCGDYASFTAQLYEDLHEIAPKWQTFGLHLGVPFDRLQGLQGDASLVDRCFTAMLATWLREGATVEQLIEGLMFPGVDQRRLAREMEKSKNGKYRACESKL